LKSLGFEVTIINFAKSLNINVITEGVETQEQLQYLRRAGCTEAQGFFLGKPVRAEELVMVNLVF
jgi:EAL domain-containing protein (putative c-di-GMP-specific phosphodiesterase class I)